MYKVTGIYPIFYLAFTSMEFLGGCHINTALGIREGEGDLLLSEMSIIFCSPIRWAESSDWQTACLPLTRGKSFGISIFTIVIEGFTNPHFLILFLGIILLHLIAFG